MKYRREIDGLRALAVVPVVLFHAGVGGFSGGFAGVDVFFVISGYLITGIILDEVARGTFSFTGFYERRARRILPALFVVVAATLILSCFVLLPEDLKAFSKSILAVMLFASNLLFWSESGYFQPDAELLPLLHTWSLAVEEQYYLVFPLVAVCLIRRGSKTVTAALLVVAILSFALAEWGSRAHPDAAFYLLPFRAWELMIGALAAVYLRSKLPMAGPRLAGILAGAGLTLLVLSISGFDRGLPWPGAYALVPVLGACLIIVFARSHNRVGRWLGSAALVGVGLVSYSAYLWHQPLFALARQASVSEPTMPVYLLLCALTFVLALLTWRFVEQPCRKQGAFSRRFAFLGALVVAMLFVGIAALLYGNKGYPGRIENHARVADLFRWQGLARPCGNQLAGAAEVQAQCRLPDGARSGDVDTLLVGDSHADAFLPALVSLSGEREISHAYIGMGGCLPLLGVDVRSGIWPQDVCRSLAQAQYAYASKVRPRKLLLVARWSMYTEGESTSRSARKYHLVENDADPLSRDHSKTVFVRALARTVRAYQALGAEVFLVEQVPQQIVEPRKVFHKLNQAGLWGDPAAEAVILHNALPISQHHAHQARVRELVEKLPHIEGFRVLNPEELFCSGEHCAMGDKDGPWYLDRDHLNIRGAQRAAPWLGRQMLDADRPGPRHLAGLSHPSRTKPVDNAVPQMITTPHPIINGVMVSPSSSAP